METLKQVLTDIEYTSLIGLELSYDELSETTGYSKKQLDNARKRAKDKLAACIERLKRSSH